MRLPRESGVSQSSILGPLLFLQDIKDMPECLNSTILSLYDSEIYALSNDSSDIVPKLKQDLKYLTIKWMGKNKLQIHPTKSKPICF